MIRFVFVAVLAFALMAIPLPEAEAGNCFGNFNQGNGRGNGAQVFFFGNRGNNRGRRNNGNGFFFSSNNGRGGWHNNNGGANVFVDAFGRVIVVR